MKNIAIALIASFGIASAFAAEPAKTTVVAATPAVAASAPAKTEMKLAKKKEDKATATKSEPVKAKEATATPATKADPKPTK